MVPEYSDNPFDGSSPHAFRTNDDPLNAQSRSDTEDMDMPDFQASVHKTNGEVTMTGPENPVPSKPLSNNESGNHKTNGQASMTSSENPEISKSLSLSNNDSGIHEATNAESRTQEVGDNDEDNDVAIKEEDSCAEEMFLSFIPGEVVDLSDAEDDIAMIKEERRESPFRWEDMSNSVILLSDDEGDVQCLSLDNDTRDSIKKEPSDVDFCWGEMGARVIELDSDGEQMLPHQQRLGGSLLGKPKPKVSRTPADIAEMQRAQQLMMERIRSQNSNFVRNDNTIPQTAPPTYHQPTVEDEHAWFTKNEIFPEASTGTMFKELKKTYKAKVKAKLNTGDDDDQFEKAEVAENARLRRLKAVYDELRGSSENEESGVDSEVGESLFVSQPPSPAPGSKRDVSAINSFAWKEASTSGVSRSKKQKVRGQCQRSQFDPDQEFETNMVSGIEEYIARRFDKKNRATGEQKAQDGQKKSLRGQKGKAKRSRRKNQQGSLSDVSSLLSGNLFDEATKANLNRDALPISAEEKKGQALKIMAANAPLDRLKDAKSEIERIRRATVTLMKRKVLPDGKGGWRLPGLRSSLHNHQVLGAAFMKEREIGEDFPLGGILADAMGLGKTLMTIATMVANPPTPEEDKRCTLIVCPPALINQWERELAKHAEPNVFPVIIKHHALTRLSGKGAVLMMEKADVVLTTYPEVVKSYPKPTPPPANITNVEDYKTWWRNRWDDPRDVLHMATFYRVVLDEAQVIKNHATHTSIACRAIMAKHRWALSGTPIMNTVEELYPYFKFLRAPFTGDRLGFRDNYCVPGNEECIERLSCMLSQIMLRRTHKDLVLGAPIVKLPKYNFRTVDLQFNTVERKLYELVYRKFVGLLNEASGVGELEKHPGLGWDAILRLRQMATHPFLAQKILVDLFEPWQVDELEKRTILEVTRINRQEKDMIAALRRMVLAKAKEPKATSTGCEKSDKLPSNELVANFCLYLRDLMHTSQWVELRQRTLCQRCGDPPEDPVVTSCFHVYCKECLEAVAYDASIVNEDQTACLKCDSVFTESQSCEGLEELRFQEAKYKLLQEAAEKDNKGKINMDWVSYDDNLILSAKTVAVRDQIETWLREEPNKKIIVFSQFHMAMRIVEKVCERKGWKFATYNGKMSHEARDKTLATFENDQDMRIMIVSLKCGGVGLNLTMASKVICVDLWFNSCVEQQAFGRVFRIGQQSETFITRFAVKGSIDETLMNMQIEKDARIGDAMDGGDSVSNLSAEDVMRLFGEVKFDRNNRPFIALSDDEKLEYVLD